MKYVQRMQITHRQAIADDDELVDGIASGVISTGDWLVQALAAWASFAQHGNGPQIAETGSGVTDPRRQACAHASEAAGRTHRGLPRASTT